MGRLRLFRWLLVLLWGDGSRIGRFHIGICCAEGGDELKEVLVFWFTVEELWKMLFYQTKIFRPVGLEVFEEVGQTLFSAVHAGGGIVVAENEHRPEHAVPGSFDVGVGDGVSGGCGGSALTFTAVLDRGHDVSAGAEGDFEGGGASEVVGMLGRRSAHLEEAETEGFLQDFFGGSPGIHMHCFGRLFFSGRVVVSRGIMIDAVERIVCWSLNHGVHVMWVVGGFCIDTQSSRHGAVYGDRLQGK